MPLLGALSVYRMTTQLRIALKTLTASGSGGSQTHYLHGSQPHHGNQPPHGSLNYQQLYYLPCKVPRGRRSAAALMMADANRASAASCAFVKKARPPTHGWSVPAITMLTVCSEAVPPTNPHAWD